MRSKSALLILRITGVILLAGSVSSDLFMPNPNPGFGVWQAVSSLFSILIIILTFKRVRHFLLKDLPVIVMNSLVFLLLLDMAAIMILRAISGTTMSTFEIREQNYASLDVVMPGSVYHPFVSRRLQPGYSDTGISVDRNGFRITPLICDAQEALEVHVYGGSTVLGWELPDSLALPARLQNLLRLELDRPVNVRNRGITARNSSQSMLEFLLTLQTGDQPDMAVFYEGYNDGATAWFAGDPGSHMGADRIGNILSGEGRGEAIASETSSELSLMTLFRVIFNPRSLAPTLVGFDPLGRGMDLEELAAQTMTIYIYNCRNVKAMIEAFNVNVVFAWQPTVAGESRLLYPLEEEILSIMDPEELLFQSVLWELARLSAEEEFFIWLGDATATANSEAYFDYCHMTPSGTEMVALALKELILETDMNSPEY